MKAVREKGREREETTERPGQTECKVIVKMQILLILMLCYLILNMMTLASMLMIWGCQYEFPLANGYAHERTCAILTWGGFY